MTIDGQRRRPGRERLLASADRVLYRDGLGTPLEDLLVEAGVARGTLYKNFPERDALLSSYLERRHEATLQILQSILDSGLALPEAIDAIFDTLVQLARDDVFRGCAFVVAAAELPDEDRPALRWARLHKRAVSGIFQKLVERAGLPHASLEAERLAILYDGALVAAFLRPESNGVDVARDMAKLIIGSS